MRQILLTLAWLAFTIGAAAQTDYTNYKMAGPYEVVARDGQYRASKAGSERDMKAAWMMAQQGQHDKAQEIINSGYQYCVDLDLEKFFDTVSHSKLIQLLGETIKDGRVISLIHKYLNAGVMVGHKYEDTTEGVPQGGPLSPILSNIMLTELDRELERRGLPFVRYADDCVIFCKSPRAAERVCESIAKFIERKLFLKVNREKTHVGSVHGQKFLGYSFNM